MPLSFNATEDEIPEILATQLSSLLRRVRILNRDAQVRENRISELTRDLGYCQENRRSVDESHNKLAIENSALKVKLFDARKAKKKRHA